MSLNGLDVPVVQEAYQQSVTEAGGWFLLKYVSRDSVELLGRGTGGVHEARNVIAKYEETSPLYGLIIYRRRKVLIKYIPENTSRLLQARTAVHFQDVVERYQPYETLIEIATADDLNDTSLAASFPLHTASPSTSSSRLQLHEISEDGEADSGPPRRPASGRANTGSIFGTQRYRKERRVDQIMRSDSPARGATPSIRLSSDTSSAPIAPTFPPTSKAPVSQYLMTDDLEQRSITDIGSDTGASSISEMTEKNGEKAGEGDVEATDLRSIAASQVNAQQPQEERSQETDQRDGKREELDSSQGEAMVNPDATERSVSRNSTSETRSLSERPTKPDYHDEPYDFSQFDALLKPKVKLGPRPVAAGERTSRQAGVATLPVNLRPVSKKQEQSRPKSQGQLNLPGPASAPAFVPPPVPDTPAYNPRPLSRGSVKSLPSHKSSTMTPDKLRLMKAVELQKRKLRKSNPQQQVPALQPEEPPEVPRVPEIVRKDPAEEDQRPQSAARARAFEERLAREDAMQEAALPTQEDRLKQEDAQTLSKKPDSGIEMEYPRSDQGEYTTSRDEGRPEQEKERTEVQISRSPDRLSHQSEAQSEYEETTAKPTAEPKASELEETAQPERFAQDDLPEVSPVSEAHYELPQNASDGNAQEASLATGYTARPAEYDVSPIEEIVNPAIAPTTLPRRADYHDLESPRNSQGKISMAKRRRGIVAPIQIDQSNEDSGGDEFVEGMQDATVHDAQPMTVAKSPIAEYFPRRPSEMSALSAQSARSTKQDAFEKRSSIPIDRFYDDPGVVTPNEISPPASRAPSTSISQRTSPALERTDPMAGRKRNVSSGITKRIQALAEHSSRDPSPTNRNSPSPLPSPDPSQAATSDRKASFRSMPRSRSSYFTKRKSAKFGAITTPEATSGAPMPTPPVWNVQHDSTTQRDSVSVTARIVRPQSRHKSDSQAPADAELQHSDIVVNHKRAAASQIQQIPTSLGLQQVDTNIPVTSPRKGAPPAIQPPTSPTQTRPSVSKRELHSASRLSFGRHRASPSTAEEVPQTPTIPQTSSSNSILSNDENAAPKEGTRTSRFFKRMSTMGGGGKRRSIAAQSMASTLNVAGTSDGQPSPVGKEQAEKPPPVAVGNLNIQFPDNLLWKRRWLEIDDAGYLIFSIPQAMDHQRGLSKKYHLSDLKAPYVPDLDRQELAHSIMLDFTTDGTTLQAACEDSATHRQVLQLLRTYHKTWAA